MTKKTTRTRAEAKKLMWEYYRDNKELLPVQIKEYREEIIIHISKGNSPAASFEGIIGESLCQTG